MRSATDDLAKSDLTLSSSTADETAEPLVRELTRLDGIDPAAVSTYQPYWAVRAHLLQLLGKTPEAVDAFDRAIGLAEDPAIRQFLLQRRG